MISVITTMYKGKAYLDGLLDNIRENTINLKGEYPDLEVEYIIVNDCPEDQVYVKGDFPFNLIVVNNISNYGIHESRAIGVKKAKGDYIQFLDQDDHLNSNALLLQYREIGKADVCVANGYEKEGDELSPIYPNFNAQKIAIKDIYYYYVGNQIISPGQCLIRKNAIPSEWLSNFMKVNCSDDYLLWLIMFAQKKLFVINKEYLFYHELTGINISGKYETKYNSNLEMCDIAEKTKSLSESCIGKIRSFSEMKLHWKNSNNIAEKLILVIKHPNIVFWNAAYKFRIR